jgi:hypothetical protein
MLYARRFNGGGQPLGAPFLVGGTDQAQEPAIEFNSAGEFAIVWVAEFVDIDDNFLGTHVMIRRYSAAGVPLGAATPLTTVMSGPEGSNKDEPDIAASSSAWIVTWMAEDPFVASNETIFARIIGFNGTELTSEITVDSQQISEFELDNDAPPRVDAADNGAFVVTWSAHYSDGDGEHWVVEARRFNSAGVAQGSKIEVNRIDRPDDDQYPDVLVDADGDFLVVWGDSYTVDGEGTHTHRAVYGRQYDRNGKALTDVFTMSLLSQQDSPLPVIAGSANGQFVVIWHGSQPGLWSRMFDGAGAVTIPRITSGAFEFDSNQRIAVHFSKDVLGTLSLDDLQITNLSTGQQVPSSSFALEITGPAGYPTTARWRPLTMLPDGNYRVTLLSTAVVDAYGLSIPTGLSLDFFILAGDANRDRKIDAMDLGILSANWQGANKAFSQADFNYDGLVDISDLYILASQWQQSLAPPPPAAQPIAVRTPPARRAAGRVVSLVL